MPRNRLVLDHLRLAVAVAGNIHKRLPRHVDVRDLRQEACIGLLRAATGFDARKGVPFRSYARRRIGGAVLDGLRKEDHLSRRARALTKADGAESSLQQVQLEDPGRVPGTLLAPYQYAAATECHRLLSAAIRTLPARLGFVLRSYYFEEKLLHEIGAELGVKEGRVSQLHVCALRMLREHFAEAGHTSIDAFLSEARS